MLEKRSDIIYEAVFLLLIAITSLSINILAKELSITIRDLELESRSTVASVSLATKSVAVNKKTDTVILDLCASKSSVAIENQCLSSDFNKDGAIDNDDLSLFLTASLYDLTKDGKLDLNYSPNPVVETDYSLFTRCLEKLPDGECQQADFNEDGKVDNTDLALFFEAFKFDLNGDGFVD